MVKEYTTLNVQKVESCVFDALRDGSHGVDTENILSVLWLIRHDKVVPNCYVQLKLDPRYSDIVAEFSTALQSKHLFLSKKG